MKLTAVFRRVPEGYMALVEELPGTNAQGETLDEAKANLREAVSTVLEANRRCVQAEIGAGEVLRESIELADAEPKEASRSFYDLDELVSRITPDNLHAPIDCGPPMGREFE